ncbi:CAMK family protein kinase [Trichomonas vaginalis G3]|uniref:CAMK family protein kinase n=1 Tax=Trichomonas vaginalis (strain ATCC PRA-98 / G3) TaxID=412133 RepID=A2E6Y1_TRIV3|nr:protein kinase superfamily [Trichomonas vaginalis G3]EAY11617.1 CAMK family protein kinase [Trichomonas vaginalis G3]KAI5516501.1 protein kinase superfamily [Trichomonas vaginalis G3]|eukprot:XP_001323840.1 CAMK family protein kinase [Trichomonas vaginalis G3]
MLRDLCTVVDRVDDRFKHIENIGTGSFGSVTKSLDTKFKRIVALKRLKDNYQHEIDEKKVVNEVTILRKLNHQNIVKLYDVFYVKSEDAYYISMEYCEQDLLALLETGKLDATTIKFFMKQILEALSYLSAHNIVHQDIKPANILVQGGNTIKFADFGLATAVDSSLSMTNCGTAPYIPPEKFFGATNFDPSADIWSTGVLFYQLIKKELIFGSNMQSDLIIREILRVCGAPDTKAWPEVLSLENYGRYSKYASETSNLSSKFTAEMKADYGQIIEHIKSMLNLVPSQRPSAASLLATNDFETPLTHVPVTEEFHIRIRNKSVSPLKFSPVVRPVLPRIELSCY